MAACSLLAAGTGVSAQEPAETNAWTVDGSWLAYTESDDRVAVRKTLLDLQRENEVHAIGVQLVHDTMSGASPTGALASADDRVTYTGASGGAGFVAGDEPGEGAGGDGTRGWFEDERVQAGVDVRSELDRTLSLSYGAVVSQESDYDSYGANVGLARLSADRATTLEVGIAATFDAIYRSEPGDTPVPLGDVTEPESLEQGRRSTFDALLGATRVLNRRTVVQLNAGVGVSTGYHSDPYKVISVVDEQGEPIGARHDSRPEQRTRATLFGKLVHQLQGSKRSVHLSYRLYGDDWGVISNTADVRYRIPLETLGGRLFLEPHLRLYQQGAADFHDSSLASDERGDALLPQDGFASADYRLDAMRSTTVGVKLGARLGARTDLRLRLERLDQRFDDSVDAGLSALIVQTSLRYRF